MLSIGLLYIHKWCVNHGQKRQLIKFDFWHNFFGQCPSCSIPGDLEKYDFETRHQQLHFLERREQDFEEQAMHLKSGGCPANSVVSNPIRGWMDHGILPKKTHDKSRELKAQVGQQKHQAFSMNMWFLN